MPNLQNNLPIICPYCNATVLAHSIIICPYCNAKVLFDIPILDLFIHTDFKYSIPAIILQKRLSKKPSNELYIKSLLLNSLKRKPILSRIVITKSRTDVITELTKTGFLTDRDTKNLNRD